MTQTPELLEVIQSDREAARYILHNMSVCFSGAQIIQGKADHIPLVQACARHRIEHATPSPVEGRGEDCPSDPQAQIDRDAAISAVGDAIEWGLKVPILRALNAAHVLNTVLSFRLAALPLPDEK